MDLTGKVVIVTGGGSGLGREMCLEFTSRGATVIASSNVVDEIEAVADECAQGGFAEAIPADVTVDDDVHDLVRTTIERHGRVDVLVNNAGIGIDVVAPDPDRRLLPDLTMDQWGQVMAVNLGGTSAVLPAMIARGSGSIVNLSSGTVRSPLPRIAAYTTSKGVSS